MYYENNDITIFYKKHGKSSKSILILPGWEDNRNTFNTMINTLKKDYSIYIIDYPYFGNSPIPNNGLNRIHAIAIITRLNARPRTNDKIPIAPSTIPPTIGTTLVMVLIGHIIISLFFFYYR